MTRRWRDVVENNPLHVHFSGNLDPEEVFGRLERLFSGNKASKDALTEPCAIRASENPRELTEYAKVQQANLIMALRTMVSRGHHLEEPLMISNGILGGFAHSRLFTQVREKESLCYSIHSNMDFLSTGLFHILEDPVYHRTASKCSSLNYIQEICVDKFLHLYHRMSMYTLHADSPV